jgi:hypothetical protein
LAKSQVTDTIKPAMAVLKGQMPDDPHRPIAALRQIDMTALSQIRQVLAAIMAPILFNFGSAHTCLCALYRCGAVTEWDR